MKKKAFKAAFPYTIPVMTGYLFLGMAFGILLSSKGYGPLWATGMSLFIYAGAMQFVAVNILIAPFNIIGTAVLTLMINARHMFYGLSMLEKYKEMGRKKLYMIFSLTDETYSLMCAVSPPEDVDPKWFRFFISLLDHSYWVTGSALGAIFGSLLTFNTEGIDFVMTALFVVIFVEQWESVRDHVPAMAGIVLTALALLLSGPQNFIIFAMIGILFFLTAYKRRAEGRANDNSTSID